MSETAAQRVRVLRKEHGWTAEHLAARCKDLGNATLSAARIYDVENGRRRPLDIAELVALCLALDVAAVHLLVPLDDAQRVALAPQVALTAKQARAWIRGGESPPGSDPRRYFSQVPLSEHGRAVDTLDVKKEG